MTTITVPDRFRYVLHRGSFEYSRAIQNLAFMLNMHLKDSHDDFLQSDVFKRLVNRAEETLVTYYNYQVGIADELFEHLGYARPEEYAYANEYHLLVFNKKQC